MFNTDNMFNTIDHQCPCCKYKAEYDSPIGTGTVFVEGDESFIQIQSLFKFNTGRFRDVDTGSSALEKVYLLGCPKCGVVSFKIV